MKKIIIFIGPPGSGKGTQAKRIVGKYGYGHISTGDLLRALSTKENPTSAEAEAMALVKQGGLVPDAFIYQLTFDEIQKYLDSGKGVVLDGTVRTVAQAETFFKHFEEIKYGGEVVAIEVALSDEEALSRLTTRKVCQKCGEIIPAVEKRTDCPKCGGELVTRADDNAEVAKNRIEKQGNQAIAPIRAFYEKKELLTIVDGAKTIPEVEAAIDEVIR